MLNQREFFSDYLPAILQEDEKAGNFTGERLFSQNSEKYKAIKYLSAEGLGAIRIAKILGVSPNTVLAVREREAPGIDIQKQQIAQRCRSAARLCLEAILDQLTRDNVEKIPVKDLGILLGILADKAELLSGGPTQRLEVIHGASHEDVEEYLMGLRRAAERQRAVEAVVLPANEPALGFGKTTGPGAGALENQVQDQPGGPIPGAAISGHPGNSRAQAPAELGPGGDPGEGPAAGPGQDQTDPAADQAAQGERGNVPPNSESIDSIDQNDRGKQGAEK